MTSEERFDSKVLKVATGCWLWNGKIAPNGYGQFSLGHARYVSAHRWGYERFRGPIPTGADLDHTCRRRACVNPDHLEPVSRRENLLRGDTIPARHSAKTQCPQGHAYTAENTYSYRGQRHCRTCRAGRRTASRPRLAAGEKQ